jgi:hydrogenase nickel incorporation protein HypA/HybF
MHELSITESILEIATRHAESAGAQKVTRINILVGRLSSVVDDSVQFYWDIISQNTICAGSILQFERTPARMKCLDCGTEYSFEHDMIPCPQCGSFLSRIISGDEFRMESIEVEAAQENPS